MRVLVIGATGFIGRHAARALASAGHEVIEGVRVPHATGQARADLALMRSPADWAASLDGIDAVVNAAGIFREHGRERFAAVHDAGARALFSACEARGVRTIVHVSALGADAQAQSRFHVSKRRGDADLAGRALEWSILYPSLVFGPNGRSARLFAALAAMPMVPIPGDGSQRVQPVHVADVAEAIVRLVEARARGGALAAVGPRAITLGDWLGLLRRQMGLGRPRFFKVPLAVVRAVVGREILGMLQRGNTAPSAPFERLLGRPPRAVEDFVSPGEALALRLTARLAWLLPFLRATVALTWLASGIVSLGLYPVSSSLALLGRTGLTGPLAYAALYGAALADVALGIATLRLRRHRQALWRLQLALIAFYTAILTAALPELWLHPFGPVLKNLPLMAAIVLLHELEPAERWNT